MSTTDDTAGHEQIPGTYDLDGLPTDIADILRRSEMARRVFVAGMARGHALALTEMVSDLKAAGAILRQSPLWDPNRKSLAEVRRRTRERYERAAKGTGPELIARAHESWGLNQVRRSA